MQTSRNVSANPNRPTDVSFQTASLQAHGTPRRPIPLAACAPAGTRIGHPALSLMAVGQPKARARKGKPTARRNERGLRHYIEGLGPYQSLILLAVPVSLVEPLKLIAVAIAGAGHWITGTITIVCAYAVSVFLIERLFRIVKPKLLTLPWFARLWNWVTAVRRRALAWFR